MEDNCFTCCVGFGYTSTWVSHRGIHTVLPSQPLTLPTLPQAWRLSQSTGFELSESCSKFPLTVCFIYDNLYTSTLQSALPNSMKPWTMPHRATQDGWVIMESSGNTQSTGEGNGKPLQHSCHENSMNSMKRQKDRTLKYELRRLVGAQNATGDQWRNNSRKNEETEPKQKQHPVVDVSGDGSNSPML